MALATDTPAGQIAPGRGGFMRNALDVPYIACPTGAVVKSGPRKGQPKRIPYGSPSSRGKLIENTFALTKFGERRIVAGIGIDLALIADCHAVAQLDPESAEFKDAADRIVLRAKDAAQASLAADRGTHSHSLSEDVDLNEDWLARAERGEVLGLDIEVQGSLVAAWRNMLELEGLEILAVEATCVDDAWRLAGTLDRIARTTRDLHFVHVDGRVTTIPAGTVLVLDVKTGKRRRRADGTVEYWHAYSIQIASYAQSVPYDTETEQRGEWPWPISQEHALIAHLDVLGAINGEPSCELVYVDVAAGREDGGHTVVRARQWSERRDVFSVGRVDEPVTQTEADVPPAEEVRVTGADPATAPVTAGIADRPAPDEGAAADPGAIEILKQRYLSLPKDIRVGWLRRLADEAIRGTNGRHRAPYVLTGDAGLHSIRRFELTRGLVLLAEHGADDDETVRSIVASIIGDDARMPAFATGTVVGAMRADEAALFARRCELLVSTTVPSTVTDDGDVVLHFDLDLVATAA